MNRYAVLTTALVALALSGCASTFVPPSQVIPWIPPLPAASDGKLSIGTPARQWWRALGDPALDALIAEAMQGNRELQATLAVVQSTRSIAEAVSREALPQGRLDAQATAVQPAMAEVNPYRLDLPRPPSARLLTFSQTLSWEIDLFGRSGTAAAIAERRMDIASADSHAAIALLQAEVVRHYTGLRMHQQFQRLLSKESDELIHRASLLRARFDAGLSDSRETLAADSELARIASERLHSEAALQGHLAALALLTGRSPDGRSAWRERLLRPSQLPAVPSDLEIVQPSDLLARRPDVARADAQLRATLGEAVLAERAHLPRLSLNLSFGLNGRVGTLGQSSAIRHAAGPLLSWDWFDAGRAQARAAAARAGKQAALHAFEQSVLKALHDSEVALRQWVAARGGLAEAQRAQSAAASAASLSLARAEAGLEPPSTSAESNGVALRATRAVVSAQADALIAFAQTQLALGAWVPEHDAGRR